MNRTAKNSIIYLTGTIITGVISFVSTMILTRVLSQQVYAMYGLLITFVTAAVTFLSLGYDASYMRFYYCHSYSNVKYFLRCIKYPLIAFIIFTIVVLEPNHWLIEKIFKQNITCTYAVILTIYILFSLIQRFSQTTVRMEEYAHNYIISNIVGVSGFLTAVVAAFYFVRIVSFTWITLSLLISSGASILINMYVFLKKKNLVGEGIDNVTSLEMFQYGFPSVVNNTFILIIPIIEKLIIRDLSGWEMLSIYTAGSIFSTVILLLQNTLDNIWNPLVYKYYGDHQKFKPILHNFGFTVTILMAAVLSVCILLRRWLVLFLGSSYYTVYIIAPGILYSSCFSMITSIYSVGINIQKKTIYMIVSPLIQMAISVFLCYLLIPRLGLIGISISSITSIVFSRLYRIILGIKLYDTGENEQKCFVIWIVCIFFSILSMFVTSLIADVCMTITLIIFLVLITNKDITALYKEMKELIKPNNKS